MSTVYDGKMIAHQLDETALGHAHHGNALRVAKDFACLNSLDRHCLDAWANGIQNGTDHVRLQLVAKKIREHEVHVVKPNEGSYAEYLDAREACGFGREGGMLESVWMGCTLEARKDMVLQLRSGELPKGWGAW